MLEVTDEESIRILRLDRPACLNALDLELLTSLQSEVSRASEDERVRVLVLKGAARAFSVGSDIGEMANMNHEDFARATGSYQQLARTFWHMRKPSIAALQGHVIGGGLELALMCDLRFASTSARFSLPDAALGFSPSGGLTFHLPRLIGDSWAAHLLLTGDVIDAYKAHALGLVTSVYEEEHLDDQVAAVTQRIADHPVTGLAHTLTLLKRDSETLERCLEHEEQKDRESFADPATQRALRAFLDARRKP